MATNFTFLLLLLIHYQMATALTDDIDTDKSALLALKSHLPLDHSQFLFKNWSDSTPVCDWLGVTCSSGDQRVAALDLSTMGLTGNLHYVPQLGNLTSLTSLDLSNNHFQGVVPSWLGSLPLLETLDLSRNGFTGFIPTSLFNAAKLEFLDMSSNDLQGQIPQEIGYLRSLKILKLRKNQLRGTFPVLSNLSKMEGIDLAWNTLSGNLPGDMCRDHSRLKQLVLHGNRFYGQIPSNISECSQLQILSLSENLFDGPVPVEMGNLRMLEILNLNYNNLIGPIPEELGNLTILRKLGMMMNELSGAIPPQLFNISTLQYINLLRNNLSGVLPTDMCSHLKQLETVYLSENQISGPVPTRLYECSSLRLLQLSVNKLNGSIPPNIGNSSTMLRILRLTSNNLSGMIPKEIGDLNTLEELYLSDNSLSGPIPPSLYNISTLRNLILSENQLSGNLGPDLGYKLPNLERLEFADNFFTSDDSFELSFITSLTNCRHLRNLDMNDNPLIASLPASVGNLSTSLQKLCAKNCYLRGSIPAEIGNLSSLIVLDLSGNQFAPGLFPKSLDNMHSLQGLDLSGNKISGAIPNTICGLRSLDELWLGDNQISGAIPDCVGNITTLRSLKLDSNDLNSHIPTSLWNLRDLHELNLSSNSLVGTLVPQMRNMRAVMSIDLSLNNFSGVIPNDLGLLQTLTLLRLAHNELQGTIPESMSNMISLKILDLSHNDLSGVVPKSFQKLQDLTSFNVSFNGLEGEIPFDGPFKNFTFESFMFNKGFCGDPRYRVPTCHNHTGKVHNPKKKRLLFSLGTFSVLLVVVILTYIVVRRYRIKDEATIPEGILRNTQYRVSYYELFEATNGYNESNLVGSGGFGSVYKAILKNGMVVAVKVFNLQLEGAFKSFEVECEVLRNIRHRNICKVIGCCSNQEFKALVLEYKTRGSLEKWLYSHNCFLDTFQRMDIMIDVACALEYLHQSYSVPVIHCDLKPSNILLDENMTAQLCDFGVAKLLGDGESMVQTMTLATLAYVAPEYGTGGFVSVKCDIYSYGIVLIEVFTRKRPNDEIFSGNLSLRSLVKDSMAIDMIDPNLLRSGESEGEGEGDGSSREKYLECVSSILELGLKCCVDSPYDRMSIKEVITALRRIKLQLHHISSVN